MLLGAERTMKSPANMSRFRKIQKCVLNWPWCSR